MGDAGEMQSLESANVGRGDDDDGARFLDAVLKPLLPLHPLHDVVRAHYLCRVWVRPRPDPDPMPADHHATSGAVRSQGIGDRSKQR